MATVDLTKVTYSAAAILSNGAQLKLEDIAENIAWEENETELAVRLNLTVRDIPQSGRRLSAALPLCTAIHLYADWGAGQTETFQGKVWEWEHSQIHDDAIIITAYDLLYYLQKSTDNRYFAQGTKTKTIITSILAAWNIPLGTYTGPDVAHQKLVFKNKTVAAMLTETLEDARKLGGGKAVIRANKGKVDVVAQGSNPAIYGFTADTNLIATRDNYSMANLVTRVVIVGKEDNEGRPKVEATMDGKTEYGILQAVQSMGSGTIAEARKAAQELLDEKGKPERRTSLQAPDFPGIRKGDLVHVTADGLKGYFYVKGISHNATSMQMQMEVEPA